jgi:hypothetical protein
MSLFGPKQVRKNLPQFGRSGLKQHLGKSQQLAEETRQNVAKFGINLPNFGGHFGEICQISMNLDEFRKISGCSEDWRLVWEDWDFRE